MAWLVLLLVLSTCSTVAAEFESEQANTNLISKRRVENEDEGDGGSATASTNDETKPQKHLRVILDNDGGYDDILSLIFLLNMPSVDVIGIIVTHADCYATPAISSILKILHLYGRLDIPVGLSSARGVNGFPAEWRSASFHVDMLPILNEYEFPEFEKLFANTIKREGSLLLRQLIETSPTPPVLVMVGPLTNLANLLEENIEIGRKLKRVLWMGGAVDAPGNVIDYIHDGTAEWNAYWDPPAVRKVFTSLRTLQHKMNEYAHPPFELVMVPLDSTQLVPVTSKFLGKVAKQRRWGSSDLAGQIWAMSSLGPWAHQNAYFMWDTLTTAIVSLYDIPLALAQAAKASKYQDDESQSSNVIRFESIKLIAEVDEPSAGRTRRANGDEQGAMVQVAMQVDADAFHEHVLKLLRNNFTSTNTNLNTDLDDQCLSATHSYDPLLVQRSKHTRSDQEGKWESKKKKSKKPKSWQNDKRKHKDHKDDKRKDHKDHGNKKKQHKKHKNKNKSKSRS